MLLNGIGKVHVFSVLNCASKDCSILPSVCFLNCSLDSIKKLRYHYPMEKRGGKRKGAGRKPLAEKKECHTITFASDEWKQIKKLSEKAGKTVSRFLIESVLD